MKKLLTIVALMLVLCLGVSAALAYTWDDLDEEQQERIQEQVQEWLGENGLFASPNVEIDRPGHFIYTTEDDEEMSGWFGACEEHDETVTEYYYKSGNSTVYITNNENVAKAAACKYDVYAKRWCRVCGYESDLVLAFAKVNHEYTTYGWVTADPSKLADGAEAPELVLAKDATSDEMAGYLCNPEVAKGTKIYLAAQCERCGDWKSLGEKKANGGHTWASDKAGNYDDTIEDVLKWALVVEYPTCQNQGWAVDYCTTCGLQSNWLGEEYSYGWAIPTVAHSYTEKEYDDDPKNLPNCKNGLTATYAIACEYGCGTYEGGVRDWDKAKKYTATLTVEEVINEGLVHEDWANFNWFDNRLIRDDWYAQNHDAEGHFYVVLSDEDWSSYPCVANASVKLTCVWCAKTKIVSTSGEEDKPMFVVVKEEPIDCYHIKLTYECAGCRGKVSTHTKEPEIITVTDADERAHMMYFAIDSENFVAPTCTKAGTWTLFCPLHPTFSRTVNEPATGHAWGAYTVKEKGNDRTIYEATCQVCKEKNYVTIWNSQDPDSHWLGTSTYWKAGDKIPGTCIAPEMTVYTEYYSDTNKATGSEPIIVYGAFGDHIMESVTAAKKAPTCTEDGIDLKICVTCTNYEPLTDAQKKDLKHDYTILDDLTGEQVFEAVIIPATGHKVETWTEKDGKLEGICTVCKQTVTKDKDLGDAAYTLSDVKFANGILSGKLVHTAGTKEAEKLSIRVTFFTAGNNYMTTSATIYADGTFEAEGAGDIEAITLVAYATDKVVNPADVANLTKLDAKEIVVK